MYATLAVVCDYASYSDDGRLNILGILDEASYPRYPAIIPTLYVVVCFSASPAEANTEKKVEVVLVDPDGAELNRASQTVRVEPSGIPGRRSAINIIVQMQLVELPAAGDYAVAVLVGGDEKRSVGIRFI